MGDRVESVVVGLWPHSSWSNCFLLNLIGFVVMLSWWRSRAPRQRWIFLEFKALLLQTPTLGVPYT